jgi:hypothetical protein
VASKRSGKTEDAGRRRGVTRRSGFHVHPEFSGGEFRRLPIATVPIAPAHPVIVTFILPPAIPGQFVGYGVWYAASIPVVAELGGDPRRTTSTAYPPPSWNKVGGLWQHGAQDPPPPAVRLTLLAQEPGAVALHAPTCGIVDDTHLASARAALLPNMYQSAPEAVLVQHPGTIELPSTPGPTRPPSLELVVKACNRCGRYLPINIHAEQQQLSFNNHCTAANRRPCKHSTFGHLVDHDTGERLRLDFGFQLECRYCKKFVVNAAHNPRRTPAQMKEDGARRRNMESLIEALTGESPQLAYRAQTGRELLDDIRARFSERCFACGLALDPEDSRLDHTRPLALLWPLDGTATLLCHECNSAKSDRDPVEFYSPEQLAELSHLTGIPLPELQAPAPNLQVIDSLRRKLDWFFDDFLMRRELQRDLDGKRPAALLVKALQKALDRCPSGAPIDLAAEYARRQRGSHRR